MSTASHLSIPRTRDDWRALALGLAERSSDEIPAGEHGAFELLRDTAWDVATYDAFWRTVQLPSLGPGLLPWMVIAVLTVVMLVTGHMPPGPWPSLSDLSNPFILWPSLWLLGWFVLTVALAAIRHIRAKRQALKLGVRIGLFPKSATSAASAYKIP